jgi:hypothetical protein
MIDVKTDVGERDIEEPEEVLDSTADETVDFWLRKQRELVTSTVDYNLGTLSDLIDSKTIDLSPRHQRRFRWDPVRQSRLIESFLMNVPVPPVFLNEDDWGRYSVIDGKQRLTAIHQFMKDRLSLTGLQVFGDLNGMALSKLPANLQAAIRTRPNLRTVIILRQSDTDVKNEVFHRLNTGGVHLNAQEVRNNAFPGPLNDLIMRLSEMPLFHEMLRIRSRQRSAIYREMRDAEFVLRFFTFERNWDTFRGGMERQMDSFMRQNQRMAKKDLAAASGRFLKALETVRASFGDHCFQRWQPDKGAWRDQVLASLYDAQMFGCQRFTPQRLQPFQQEIVESFKLLFSDSDFRKAIDAATNTPSYFRARILTVRDAVTAALHPT